MIPMPASDTLPLATLFSFVIFQLVRIGFQALSHKPRVHYHLIKLVDGRVIRRHIDHIRERSPLATAPLPIHPSRDDWTDDTIPHTPNPPNQSHDVLRRSSRNRKPPDRLHT